MRKLTVRELEEQYKGVLPPDAVLVGDRTDTVERLAARPTPSPRVAGRGNTRRATVARRFRDLSEFMRTVHWKLTPTQRTVWLSVYTFTERGRATVTQKTLARIGNVTVRAVQKAVPGLVNRGLLDVLEQGRPGRSSVYRYRLA